ncbi:hypothetical protein DNL40_04700 [Xylanimonas oleitrophica]|uniref:Uncharacterized protein n=1 Tax=Xylanimonas oleitrophica TaxID=2607479 RepID=A0A2W5WUC3_9MICO|nr:hypothetical protein [Xylanimonas oleitrophica]PZR54223.1 hypothetical protein DNL40_04700 [Xylanimonas oleitrophica]
MSGAPQALPGLTMLGGSGVVCEGDVCFVPGAALAPAADGAARRSLLDAPAEAGRTATRSTSGTSGAGGAAGSDGSDGSDGLDGTA